MFDDERRRDVDDGRPYTIVPPLREAFDQGLRLARVYDEYDDVLVMPGLIAARTGTNAYEALEDNDSYRPHDRQDREEVGLFELQADPLDPETVERTLEEVGRLLASEPDVPTPVAPVYGFRTHQTNHPSEDPEPVPDPPLPVPTADREPKRGETVTVVVVDTGWHRTAPWTGRLAGRLKADEEQPAAGNLGFAAGHGSHVAGIILQLAPQARVVVKKAVRPDGFVTEKRLFRVLSNLPKLRWRPDILVLPLGGPAIGLGSFSTAPAERDTQRALDPAAWAEPIMLLKALEALVRDVGELAIVASAGNDDSSEPCYPAAFTWSASASERLKQQMIAVAALEANGSRYCYSNYGEWVNASATGVRIRSMFVEGIEDPLNDPDLPPDDFRVNPYAEWSGTSFAAPAVAGQLARELLTPASRSSGTGPIAAWNNLRQRSLSTRPLLGSKIDVPGLPHG